MKTHTNPWSGSPVKKGARRTGLIWVVLAALWVGSLAGQGADNGLRLKDLVMIAGARENQLVGYGLVTGLNNDGDKNPVYTVQSVANALQRFGITVSATALSAKNVAAVMVTAEIPPFARNGSRLDVTVSAMGDAKSLQGGVLLQTPLVGADGKVYAIAQGALSIGGFTGGAGGAGGATVTKNHPTVGQIPNGALVEKEIPAEVVHDNTIELLLRQPDFTSAARIALAVNEKFPASAEPLDASVVKVRLPENMQNIPVNFLALLEAIEVVPDTVARVVVNERTGTIVATTRVRISACAVSHGGLTITIASTPEVSQPAPFSQGGNTTVAQRTETKVSETKASFITLQDMPTIDKVASGLNAIGVTARDMIAIFQAMKQAGALQADLVLR